MSDSDQDIEIESEEIPTVIWPTFLYLFGFLGGGFLWVLYGKDILDFGDYYRNLAFGGMIVCFVVEVVISGALKMKVYAFSGGRYLYMWVAVGLYLFIFKGEDPVGNYIKSFF